MKVMIATGGTGGHIYPALALAKILRQEDPSGSISFIGSSNRMEAQLIPEQGYPFLGMPMSGMNGSLAAKARSAVSLLRAQGKCHHILQEKQPDICIGFGNYISVPLIMAAHGMKIPTMIHEQNSFAGKANQMLGRYADAAVICYENAGRQLPADKTRLYGNPEATLAAGCQKKPELIRSYGLDPNLPLAVFMMGSLGSETVAAVIDQAIDQIDAPCQLLIAAGKDNDYKFQHRDTARVKIVPYLPGLDMLASADLAVTRAGATTMAEIAALGCAAILVPSPFVPNNHQVYNAMELVRQQAAVMLEEKDLSAASLARQVNALMQNTAERNKLKANALAQGKPDAAYQMIRWMEELADHGSIAE